jgi:hypothetical protein
MEERRNRDEQRPDLTEFDQGIHDTEALRRGGRYGKDGLDHGDLWHEVHEGDHDTVSCCRWQSARRPAYDRSWGNAR